MKMKLEIKKNQSQNVLFKVQEILVLEDIILDQNTSLEIVFLLDGKSDFKKEINVFLKKDSDLKIFLFASDFLKIEFKINIIQDEENSNSGFFALIKGKDQSFCNLEINNFHKASNTKSNQLIKSLGKDNSKIEILSKVNIEKKLFKIETNQEIKNLFLSPNTSILVSPVLEIQSRDIIAKHGFSNTKILEQDYFFLQTRGFSKEQAELILIQAFVEDIFKKLDPVCKANELKKDFL